jgi:hypothetical protein
MGLHSRIIQPAFNDLTRLFHLSLCICNLASEGKDSNQCLQESCPFNTSQKKSSLKIRMFQLTVKLFAECHQSLPINNVQEPLCRTTRFFDPFFHCCTVVLLVPRNAAKTARLTWFFARIRLMSLGLNGPFRRLKERLPLLYSKHLLFSHFIIFVICFY